VITVVIRPALIDSALSGAGEERPASARSAKPAESSMPNVSMAPRSARRGMRRLSQILLCALAIVFSAGVAQAAGDDHDPVREMLWQGFNLALLVGVIVYYGRGPISEFFASRRDGIKTELADAADLLRQALQRNAKLQRRLVDLSSEIEEISENAGRRADEEAERILADARATADRIRRDATAAIDQELRRAQAALHDEAADLALEIAARKLTESVVESDRERLIDEFITRIEPSSPGATGASTEGANR